MNKENKNKKDNDKIKPVNYKNKIIETQFQKENKIKHQNQNETKEIKLQNQNETNEKKFQKDIEMKEKNLQVKNGMKEIKRQDKNENIETLNRYNHAISFAVERHSSQKRKGTPWPYVVHLYEVAALLQESGCNEETVMAGILHDTVEDTDTTLIEIEKLFGKNIATMVDVLSENKQLPYRERKLVQAQRIREATFETKMVKCADCLSNIKSIYFDMKRDKNIWSRFNSGKEDIKEHYKKTIESITELNKLNIYQSLKQYYKKVFE